MEQIRRISLTIPHSWAQCSLEQLELIAAELMAGQLGASFVPQDTRTLKARLFFALAGLDIVVPAVEGEEEAYCLCRRHGKEHKNEPSFPVYAWQVSDWIDKQMKWFDTPCTGFVIFPFPEIRLRKNVFRRKTFFSPQPLMQDFSWQRYRLVQDYLQLYYRQQNLLLSLGKKNLRRKENRKAFVEQMKKAGEARSMFLSLLFTSEHKVFDRDTRKYKKTTDYDYDLAVANSKYFDSFSEIKMQVVLMWWTGVMTYLQTKYPHIFKSTGVAANAKVNPLEVYARMTATIEKHIGIDEGRLNNENFHIVLQHFEDIAVTNEEYEKIKRK